ncbi:MAG: PilZ domain-containing protein [Cyanobium sp.]
MPSHLPNLSDDGRSPVALFEAETILFPVEDPENFDDFGPDEGQRRHERQVAPPCRPVPVQLLLQNGSPQTEWFYADILDISLGGLCLLITENHTFDVGHSLLVDFKAHRGGDLHRVPGLVRWFVRSGSVTTMGVGFDEPLTEIPQLLPERRTRLRNPNDETSA